MQPNIHSLHGFRSWRDSLQHVRRFALGPLVLIGRRPIGLFKSGAPAEFITRNFKSQRLRRHRRFQFKLHRPDSLFSGHRLDSHEPLSPTRDCAASPESLRHAPLGHFVEVVQYSNRAANFLLNEGELFQDAAHFRVIVFVPAVQDI